LAGADLFDDVVALSRKALLDAECLEDLPEKWRLTAASRNSPPVAR
jgi:hypothetical protein